MRTGILVAILAACSSSHHAAPGDGGAGSDGSGSATACTPSCASAVCGDDGCGGACGACAPDELCNSGSCRAAPGGADLIVDPTAGPHPIHPEIYGMAYAASATMTELRLPVNRWGGNGATLYNWQLDVHNTGNDYYFENIADSGEGGASSADTFVAQNAAAGTDSLVTIPTIGWTPKDRVANHPYTCGFPVSAYGAEQAVDPYDANCGNGVSSGGAQLVPDPTHDAMAIDPSFASQWLAHLVQTHGAAGAGGIRYYQLDNEMNLWGSTHRDVHPNPTSSDEVWNATASYAPLIKAADPGAFVLGYTTWGVLDMFVSALDTANNSTADQQAHGGIPLGQWYLRQLAGYEQAHGARIVDCYDMHYYPQGGDPLQNTRSLWDPSYHDPSWLDGYLGEPIRLLPRVMGWIAMEDPGTGICFTEYNFNLDDESDATAVLPEADVLGIFGAWGVRLATYWTTPTDSGGAPLPPYRAFQIFRDYDGAGGAFGAISIGAASDLADVVAYAASDSASAPTTLTIVILNKATSPASPTLALQHFTPSGAAKVWQTAGTTAPARAADVTFAAGKATLALPASSVTMVVVQGS
ncbi:MAG TPA: glycoside hydrolase family 44 protein [Kofleriaceae bacterium]|nr:glycoside hydrolase family 44 protein [Kofleriaceae bacterium]